MAANKDEGQRIEHAILQTFKHLLEDNNVVVSLNNEGFHFRKETIKSIIESHPLGRKEFKTLPVEVLTVVGSNEYKLRNVLTFWLISYYEHKTESSFINVEQFNKIFHRCRRQIFENSKNAIYVWPKPYLIQSEQNQPERILLLFYSNILTYQGLDLFAAASCSQMLVTSEKDRNGFENKFEEIWSKADKRHSLVPKPNFSIMANSGTNDFSKLFIDSLRHDYGSNDLFASRNSLIAHIKNLAAIFNAAVKDGRLQQKIERQLTEPTGKPANSHHMRPNTGSKESGPSTGIFHTDASKSQNHFKRSDQPGTTSGVHFSHQDDSFKNDLKSPTMVIGLTKQFKINSAISSESQKSVQDQSILAADCNMGKCLGLQTDIKGFIHEWVKTDLNLKNINAMLDCCSILRIRDKHNIFIELHDVIHLVNSYSSTIANKFDNRVCFVENGDVSRFCNNAYQRAVSLLAEKNHTHHELTRHVLEEACSKIYHYYFTDNQIILENERRNADKVLELVEKAYSSIFLDYIESEGPNYDYTKYHLILKEHCIALIENCLNFEDRANEVAMTAIKLVSRKLDKRFQSIMKSKNLNVIRPENIESTLALLVKSYLQEMHKLITFKFEGNSAESVHHSVEYHHKSILQKIFKSMVTRHQDDIQVKLHSYLVYVTEALLQKHQRWRDYELSSKETSSVPQAVSLFIGRDLMFFHFPTENGYNCMVIPEKNSITHPALLALTSKDEVLYGYNADECMKSRSLTLKCQGVVTDYLCNNVENNSFTGYIMVSFFQQLKNTICDLCKSRFDNWVISIPIYVSNSQRLRLRNFAINAGLKNIYIISETSVLAHGILNFCKIDNSVGEDNLGLVVILQATNNFIRLFVFTKNSKGQTKIMSYIRKAWIVIQQVQPHDSNDIDKNDQQQNQLTANSSNTDYNLTLSQALADAFSQIEPLKYNPNIPYCILNNSFHKEQVFGNFFNRHKNWLKIENFVEYIEKALINLCREPENITSTLIDHALAKEDNDDFKGCPTVIRNLLDIDYLIPKKCQQPKFGIFKNCMLWCVKTYLA